VGEREDDKYELGFNLVIKIEGGEENINVYDAKNK